ncbi:hypothetical protein OPKNFCMD_0986 [Methylobacterium crusticola]|uniref:Uncharacterized protein n=1 Tax=Methylobacterium crusticola TaxID=1697972 RepID=A0ABQ4QSQ9_9HYPH|nr:hypothetical protein [Methylobacterium crusticola]GJD48269.1 hypothetical protein OPKNFCMD_0986 [Methylobacterium crusticola]
MQDLDLDEPADLTVWCSGPGRIKAVEPMAFTTLRAALSAARSVISTPGLRPWIVTAGGLILTPAWLEGYAAHALSS